MSPADPRLTVAAVARRLGVAPATLRTWDRRYGIGPSEHEAGTRRRYSAADLARLEAMHRLTLQGVPPAEAAAAALDGVANARGSAATEPPAPELGRRLAALALNEPAALGPEAAPGGHPDVAPDGPYEDPAFSLDSDETIQPGPGGARGGGRVLALPGAAPAVRGLARAAMSLDAGGVGRLISRGIGDLGVVRAWDELVAPVLVAVGNRWARTGQGVDVEHLLSECAIGALRQAVSASPVAPVRTPRPVLLACCEDEGHSLPLHALAAALAERGIAARMLGAALPDEALLAAVRRSGPSALFLWSQFPSTADVEVITALPPTRPATAVVVGGPGWDPDALPPRARYAARLTDAVEMVGLAAGSPA